MHQNSPLLYGNLDAQLQGAKERGQSVKVTKVCRLCDVTLDSPADFEKHQHCVLLSCRKCQFQAKTLDSFNEHIRKHQTKYLEQKCNICQEVFSSPITHAVHKRKIHGVYDCRYCIAEFLSKTDWSNHMKVSHNEIGKKNTNLAQTSKQDPPHRKLLVHNMPKSLSNPASKQDPSPHRKLLVHSMPMSVSNPASKQDPSPHRKLLVHNMPMSVSNPPAGLIMCSPPQSIDDLCTTNMPTPSAICNPQIYSRNTPRKQPLTLIEEVIIKVEPSSDTESAVPQTILKKVKQKRKKRLEKMREFQGLPCESCPAAFKTLTALRIHVKQKHTEKPRCPVCGLTRSSARKVFQHQITAHKEKFRCRSYCLELFDTREELSAHHISVHKKDDTVNKCRYCRIPYTRGTYEEHLQECLGDIRAKRVKTCPLCDRKFVDHAEFSHHLKTCESSGGKPDEEGESPGTSGSVGKKPIGKKLEELESNAKQLDKHPVLVNMQNVESIEKKSGESAMLKLEDTNQCVTNSFKCRFCPKVFHCEENGVDHMINQHKTVFSHMKEYKVCDICGKLFISGLSLCKHLVMHYEKRAVWNKLVPANFSKNDIKGNCWICKTSGVSYSPNHCKARNSIIDKHLHSKACKTSVTDSNETFHCCLCKETFSDVHGYWNHIKIHLHKNPSASTKKDQYFSCPRCPQKYKKEAQLMEHVAMHLIQQDSHGERNEKSKSNSTLADTKDKMDENLSEEELQEEANHTELETDASVDNMGTFKCLHCKQGFGVKSDALNHLLSIHNKVLKEIISLKSCHLCDKSFLKGSSLCSHILNHYIELGMWEDMVPRNLLSKIDKQRCWICNTVFRNKKRGHQRIRNDCIEKSLSSRSEQLEEDEQFQCPLCEFSCSNRYDHWKHIKLHLFLNKNFLGKTNADSKGEKTDADSKGEKTDADSKGEKMDADSKGEKTDADSKGEKMDADSKGEQSTPMLDSVKGKFDCLKCNEQFTESLDFRKHIATHFLRLCEKRKRKISEVDCDEQEAKKRKTMTLRSTSFRPGHGNLRCVCCSGTFSSSEDAIYHVLFAHKDKVTQAKEPEFACKVCGASFKGGWWLCKHVINHYVNLEMWNALVPRDLVNNLNKRNQCWICKCVLDKNYVGHISKRNAYIEPLLTANCKEKTSLFDCSLCNLQFPTRPKYWLHMTSHLCQPPTEFTPQNLPLPKEDKKKDYECSDCTLYFQNEEEYHKHLASHFLECTEEEKSATSIGLEEHGREEFVPSRESSDDEWLPPSIVKTKIDESMTQEDEKGNNCQEEMEGDDNVANDSESEDEENVGYDKEDEGDENVAYDREDEGEVDVAYDREDEGDENVAHDSEPDIIVENIKTEDEGSSWFEEM